VLVELGKNRGQERRHSIFETLFSNFELIDKFFEFRSVEALETRSCRRQFKLTRLFVSSDKLLGHLEFIARFGMTVVQASVHELGPHLLENFVKAGLDLVYFQVGVVKFFIDS